MPQSESNYRILHPLCAPDLNLLFTSLHFTSLLAFFVDDDDELYTCTNTKQTHTHTHMDTCESNTHTYIYIYKYSLGGWIEEQRHTDRLLGGKHVAPTDKRAKLEAWGPNSEHAKLSSKTTHVNNGATNQLTS